MIIEKWYAHIDEAGRVTQFQKIEVDNEGPNEPKYLSPNPTVELEVRPNLTPQPSPTSVLRVVDRIAVWQEEGTVEQVRAWKWKQLKASRTEAELADFEFEGKLYQANKEQINGYVTMAMIALHFGQPFSQQWTLKDNSVEVFDAQRMVGLGVALGTRVASIYSRGRALRAKLDDPDATVDGISSIEWNSPI